MCKIIYFDEISNVLVIGAKHGLELVLTYKTDRSCCVDKSPADLKEVAHMIH